MGARVAVTRLADSHRFFMDQFIPPIWGGESLKEGIPMEELPDKRFGRWVEESVVMDYRIDRPRLIFCKVPMETVLGKHIVSYTTLRLPCGGFDGAPEHVVAITRLEDSLYKTLRDAQDDRAPPPLAPTPPTSRNLRLVKS